MPRQGSQMSTSLPCYPRGSHVHFLFKTRGSRYRIHLVCERPSAAVLALNVLPMALNARLPPLLSAFIALMDAASHNSLHKTNVKVTVFAACVTFMWWISLVEGEFGCFGRGKEGRHGNGANRLTVVGGGMNLSSSYTSIYLAFFPAYK